MRSNFWFGVGLTLSIIFVVLCFENADAWRGYNATGGEVFTLALPLTIVGRKVSDMAQRIESLRRRNRCLRKTKKGEVK